MIVAVRGLDAVAVAEQAERIVKAVDDAQSTDPHRGRFFVDLSSSNVNDPQAVRRAAMDPAMKGYTFISTFYDGNQISGLQVCAPGFSFPTRV